MVRVVPSGAVEFRGSAWISIRSFGICWKLLFVFSLSMFGRLFCGHLSPFFVEL